MRTPSSNRYSFKVLFCTAVLVLSAPALVLAEAGVPTIEVQQCGASLSKTHVVPEGSEGVVRIKLEKSDEDEVSVSLTNRTTGESRIEVVRDGYVTFSGVSSGEYSVCPIPGSVAVKSLDLESARIGGSNLVVASAGVVGVAGLTAGLAGRGSGSDSSSGASSEPESAVLVETKSAPVQGPQSSSDAKSVSQASSEPLVEKKKHPCVAAATADRRAECLTEEEPEPISKFF